VTTLARAISDSGNSVAFVTSSRPSNASNSSMAGTRALKDGVPGSRRYGGGHNRNVHNAGAVPRSQAPAVAIRPLSRSSYGRPPSAAPIPTDDPGEGAATANLAMG
jgi:hypothetical protein